MRLIVTHEQPDFDALASLALAKLLFPGSVATIQGALSKQLRAFITLYRDELELTPAADIDLGTVRELVVVDTADPQRIKPFDELLGKVPVTLYDHHPTPPGAIEAARGISEQIGATASLLTRELHATSVPIPAPVATLALLGIHEDTGNLTYDNCAPDDYRAAAHLLASGANLGLVRRFAHDTLGADQRAFRDALLQHATTTEVAGRQVVVAAFDYPTYVPAVSGLVNDLLDLYAADAAIVSVSMERSTLVFARSNQRFDCAAALAEALGGGGHPGAAFAKTERPPAEALERVLEALENHAAPALSARALMSAPVKTAQQDDTVASVVEKLLLFGHNGMPVLDDAGTVVGVVSRRDLDRALRHGLGASRVGGFMSREVVSVEPDASLPQLEELVLKHNIGRIPVVERGRLVGIVTRTDLIGARHRRPHDDRAATLLERLPTGADEALRQAAELAGDSALFLVGGTVRDLLLGAGIRDLDLVVEGSAAQLGARLQLALGGTLSAHVDFGTATLALPGGLQLDLATAREETYSRPGALPDVTPSSIRKDMSRRDFTINAMALRLNPAPAALFDPYSGEDDLAARRLRVLHPLSFVEDPTRILRGARLAGRLGFQFEAGTAARAREALQSGALASVSRSRSRAELELTLAEPRVAPALRVLEEFGALQAIFGLTLGRTFGRTVGLTVGLTVRADQAADAAPRSALKLVEALDALRSEGEVPDEAYLLALLVGAVDAEAEQHVEAFNWPRRHLQTRAKLLDLLSRLADEQARSETEGSEGGQGEAAVSEGARGEAAVPERPRGGAILDEELEALDPPARALLRAAAPALVARLERLENQPPPRRLRGSDVLGLGLLPGPDVGRVLDAVARARAGGQVSDFEEELDLARRLVSDLGSAHDLE